MSTVIRCKECGKLWISPKKTCSCGCGSFTVTAPSKRDQAQNYSPIFSSQGADATFGAIAIFIFFIVIMIAAFIIS